MNMTDTPIRILIVDDDELLADLCRHAIQQSRQYIVHIEETAGGALLALRTDHYDLAILDINLPDGRGTDILRHIRKDLDPGIGVILLSATKDPSTVVDAFEQYADDYIAKPFIPEILLARIDNILRLRKLGGRSRAGGTLTVGDLTIDPDKHTAHLAGLPIELRGAEFRALAYLAQHPGIVRSREQIGTAVVPDKSYYCPSVIDNVICRIRKKLGTRASMIETVPTLGYRLLDAPHQRPGDGLPTSPAAPNMKHG